MLISLITSRPAGAWQAQGRSTDLVNSGSIAFVDEKLRSRHSYIDRMVATRPHTRLAAEDVSNALSEERRSRAGALSAGGRWVGVPSW